MGVARIAVSDIGVCCRYCCNSPRDVMFLNLTYKAVLVIVKTSGVSHVPPLAPSAKAEQNAFASAVSVSVIFKFLTARRKRMPFVALQKK